MCKTPLILLGIFLAIVYGVLYFCIPFILYAIMKNTNRTADLLAQMKSLVISQPCIKECRSRQSANATREQLRRVAGIALRGWPRLRPQVLERKA
jgi:hypothetical protein